MRYLTIISCLTTLLSIFSCNNINSTFYGYLEVQNLTKQTQNGTIIKSSPQNLHGQKVECEIFNTGKLLNHSSSVETILRPVYNNETYNIENRTCLTLDIIKPDIFGGFQLNEQPNPERSLGFEIESLRWNPINYTIHFTTIMEKSKTYFDWVYVPKVNNFTFSLWLRFYDDFIQFGYKGNDQPLRKFFIKPKYFIPYNSENGSVAYVIKDSNQNCSSIRSTSETYIAKCTTKMIGYGNSSGDYDNNKNDSKRWDNSTANCKNNSENQNIQKNISSFLVTLVQHQNDSYKILQSDSLTKTVLVQYLTLNSLNEFIFRVNEVYANAIDIHRSIMQYIPQNNSDQNYKLQYLNSNLYIDIRKKYFEIYMATQALSNKIKK